MIRRVQILRGNMLFTTLNLLSFIFQGIIMGTVFFSIPENTSAYFSRGGVQFFALLFSALTAMSEVRAWGPRLRKMLIRPRLCRFRLFTRSVRSCTGTCAPPCTTRS